MSDIEHTITVTVRKSLWPKAMEGFRFLRKQHQAAGGTSRLVKDDDVFTFTAKGPDIAGLDEKKDSKEGETNVGESDEA